MANVSTQTGFLDKRSAAAYCSLSARSLDLAKGRGDLPYVRFSIRKVLFARADLDRWLAAKRVEATSTTREGVRP